MVWVRAALPFCRDVCEAWGMVSPCGPRFVNARTRASALGISGWRRGATLRIRSLTSSLLTSLPSCALDTGRRYRAQHSSRLAGPTMQNIISGAAHFRPTHHTTPLRYASAKALRHADPTSRFNSLASICSRIVTSARLDMFMDRHTRSPLTSSQSCNKTCRLVSTTDTELKMSSTAAVSPDLVTYLCAHTNASQDSCGLCFARKYHPQQQNNQNLTKTNRSVRRAVDYEDGNAGYNEAYCYELAKPRDYARVWASPGSKPRGPSSPPP